MSLPRTLRYIVHRKAGHQLELIPEGLPDNTDAEPSQHEDHPNYAAWEQEANGTIRFAATQGAFLEDFEPGAIVEVTFAEPA